jgi:hypothetical protein
MSIFDRFIFVFLGVYPCGFISLFEWFTQLAMEMTQLNEILLGLGFLSIFVVATIEIQGGNKCGEKLAVTTNKTRCGNNSQRRLTRCSRICGVVYNGGYHDVARYGE